MESLRGFLILIRFFLVGEMARLGLELPFSAGVLGLVLCQMLWDQVPEGLGWSASHSIISVLELMIMPGVVGIF